MVGPDRGFGYYCGRKAHRRRQFLFASFQKMQGGYREFERGEFDFIVVDESHHSHARTYREVIEYFRPKQLLGITATPDRTDLQDIRGIYGDEVFALPFEDALAQGLLTEVDYHLMADELQNLEILERPIGRVSIRGLNKRLFIPRRDEEVVRIIQQRMGEVQDPRVIIFCQSVMHCDRLAELMPRSYAVHYEISRRRQDVRLERFRAGLANTLLTVDKFNEGIDIPEANVIVFLRSTTSRTVFLQQLGRGLRRHPSKDRVVVLDFAANCERLQMVNELWEIIGAKLTTSRRNSIDGGPKPFKLLDLPQSRFTVSTKQILEVIKAVRSGYTKEVLALQLITLARALGRVPTTDDLRLASKRGVCAHEATFRRTFGSLYTALDAAGLRGYKRGYKRKELVQQLKGLRKQLGRRPTRDDVNQAAKEGRCASAATFLRVFRSFAGALNAAGIRSRAYSYRKETLVGYLHDLTDELGRPPRWSDVRKASRRGVCPHPMTFERKFGSFSIALAEVARLVSR